MGSRLTNKVYDRYKFLIQPIDGMGLDEEGPKKWMLG